jgi:hypothetical protein
MKVMFAPLEPLLRLAGLPAIFLRETVEATVHLNYSSARAQRELGWSAWLARRGWLRL